MITLFPQTFEELPGWAKSFGMTLTEARVRFAQFAVLSAIAESDVLRQSIVFKGGNALDFVWQPNRSTQDLDFSLDVEAASFEIGIEQLRSAIEPDLARVGERLEIYFHVNSVRKHPPGEEKTFATFQTRIGYALPDQDGLKKRMSGGHPSPQVVPVEISVNEPICEARDVNLGGNSRSLRVSTVEDIVAEKLRAILQQTSRNRYRKQDVLDIAVILSQGIPLDREKVARFLVRKSAARDVTVSRAAFHDPEIGIRAHEDYADLEANTRVIFIPFDEALAMLLAFVDKLDIPENE